MKLYIAGPMRNIPLCNFPAFDDAKLDLVSQGHTVVSPADIDRECGFDPFSLPEDYDWNKIPAAAGTRDEIIRRDIAALLTCNAIYLLRGWEGSVGARAEAALARWNGMTIFEQQYADRYTNQHIIKNIAKEIGEHASARIEKSRDEFFSTFPKDAPVATKDSNPKDNVGCRKPGLSAIPCAPLFEAGAALDYGGKKYGRHNWRDRGVRASIYYDAVMRHVMAWWEGEDIDPVEQGGSGLPHLAHAIAGLMIYRDAEIAGNVTDDRPIAYGNPSVRINQVVSDICDRYPGPVAPFTQKAKK